MSWGRGALLAGAILVVSLPAAGQQQERPWKLNGELGASVFFGASEQAAVLSRGNFEWKDPRWEFGIGGSFDYGEADDPDDGRFVNKRAWSAQMSTDYLPSGRFSPFVFVAAEGSLQRQIDTRTSGGAGGRYRFIDDERSRLDLSLAALAERTDPRQVGPEPTAVSTIGRWSTRFRVRKRFSEDRIVFDLVSFYQPRMDDFDQYTIDLTSSLTYALTSIVGLKISLVDRYDSRAVDRGALSNNEGQLFFSVTAALR